MPIYTQSENVLQRGLMSKCVKVGSKGAPTASAFKAAKKTAKRK